jgi:3-polyprenyl-4-hydroxybenzoate decarboxylase
MEIVDHSVDRALDLIGAPDALVRRWEGKSK